MHDVSPQFLINYGLSYHSIDIVVNDNYISIKYMKQLTSASGYENAPPNYLRKYVVSNYLRRP